MLFYLIVEGTFCFVEKPKYQNQTEREIAERWEKLDKNAAIAAHEKKSYGFVITKKKLFKDLYGLDPHEKVLFLALRLYADPRGHCYPSMRTLAEDLGLNKKTIQKYIQSLKRKEFLKIITARGRGGKRFEYELLK